MEKKNVFRDLGAPTLKLTIFLNQFLFWGLILYSWYKQTSHWLLIEV